MPSRYRLSKPILLLIVLVPIVLCVACFVQFERAEEQHDRWRTVWQSVVWGDTAEVRKRLQAGDVDREGLDEMLRMAANDNFEEAIPTLLSLGVNTHSKDSEGHTALQIAEGKGNWQIVKRLRQSEHMD